MSAALVEPRRGALVAALLVVAAVVGVAWPLATYTLSLACFGLAHVVAELRYVDLRFGRRLSRALAWSMAAALAGIVLARAGPILGVLDRSAAVLLELACGLSLVALVLPTLWRVRRWTSAVGLAIAVGLAVAILVAPAAGLLTIAVLHNFTPVGFVLDATSGARRRRAAYLCLLVFAVVPAVIASGWVWAWVASAGIAAPEASPLGYGPLHDAMRAYLPVSRLSAMTALHLFSACVFLQCAHYVAVLLVMPRLLPARAEGRLRWPSARWWGLVLGGTLLAAVPFSLDFADARQGYGVLAAVHAWIELPILLLALLGARPYASR